MIVNSLQGERDNGERVADFVLLVGIYVVRLSLEDEQFTENENLLGAQQFKVDIGFYTSLYTITADH